jgi:hypothetical protein
MNYTPATLGGHKVDEKLHLGVREQKRLNATALASPKLQFVS